MNRKTIIEMNQQNKSQVFGPLFDKYNQVLEKRGHKLHKVGKLHLDPMLCLHTKIFGNSLRTDNLLINKVISDKSIYF